MNKKNFTIGEKYLITSDNWFTAPDGTYCNSAFGNILILDAEDALGINTNEKSTNWYVRVGNDSSHVIIAGCQIHYAVRCDSISPEALKDRPKDIHDSRPPKIWQPTEPKKLFGLDIGSKDYAAIIQTVGRLERHKFKPLVLDFNIADNSWLDEFLKQKAKELVTPHFTCVPEIPLFAERKDYLSGGILGAMRDKLQKESETITKMTNEAIKKFDRDDAELCFSQFAEPVPNDIEDVKRAYAFRFKMAVQDKDLIVIKDRKGVAGLQIDEERARYRLETFYALLLRQDAAFPKLGNLKKFDAFINDAGKENVKFLTTEETIKALGVFRKMHVGYTFDLRFLYTHLKKSDRVFHNPRIISALAGQTMRNVKTETLGEVIDAIFKIRNSVIKKR